jgi:hypothetical protein
MQLRSLKPILASLFIACGTLVSIAEPNQASGKDKYYCAVWQGVPRTFVRTELGDKRIISWVNQTSTQWNPRRRCVEVSKRFQRFADMGNLLYIGTGNVTDRNTNYPVLCAVRKKGEACNNSNILITLPPGTDAQETARKLLDTRNLVKGREIFMNGDDHLESYDETQGENYYNFNMIRELAPPVEGNLTPVNN